MTTKYANVSIPKKLADSIDNYIIKNFSMDFRSRAEVVKYALRKLLIEENSENTFSTKSDEENVTTT